MRRIPKINFHAVENAKEAILGHLKRDEVVIVSGLSLNERYEPLRSMCLSLGIPSSGVDKNLSEENSSAVSDKEFIHRVAMYDEPLKDPQGNPILSTTSLEFPCHTDEYFRKTPSNILAMHIVHARPC